MPAFSSYISPPLVNLSSLNKTKRTDPPQLSISSLFMRGLQILCTASMTLCGYIPYRCVCIPPENLCDIKNSLYHTKKRYQKTLIPPADRYSDSPEKYNISPPVLRLIIKTDSLHTLTRSFFCAPAQRAGIMVCTLDIRTSAAQPSCPSQSGSVALRHCLTTILPF